MEGLIGFFNQCVQKPITFLQVVQHLLALRRSTRKALLNAVLAVFFRKKAAKDALCDELIFHEPPASALQATL